MQKTNKWKVICTGNIEVGFLQYSVVNNLKKQFHFTEVQAQALIKGIPTVVKKDLEQTKAQQYKTALERVGLEVILEGMPAVVVKSSLDGLALVSLDDPDPDTDTDTDTPSVASDTEDNQAMMANEMRCPKCYKIQLKADECMHCGIIISRFLEKQQQISPIAEEKKVESSKYNDHENPLSLEDATAVKLASFALFGLFVLIMFFIFDGDYRDVGDSIEARAQIQAYRKANSHPVVDTNNLRDLLQKSRYSEVESILSELHQNVLEDISWEPSFEDTVESISKKNNYQLDDLDNWVDSTGSAYAYMARGAYYSNAADAARGDKWASQTTAAQFALEAKLNKKAHQDLLEAKSINNALLPLYSLLIDTAQTSDRSITTRAYLDEAISIHPGGYYYRYSYIRFLMPKWGGSWGEMQGFIDETALYFNTNPRLWIIQGYIAADKGYRSCDGCAYSDCVKFFSEALQYGVHSGWLSRRAVCLYNDGEYEKSLIDVNMSLDFNGDNEKAKELKGYLEGRM